MGEAPQATRGVGGIGIELVAAGTNLTSAVNGMIGLRHRGEAPKGEEPNQKYAPANHCTILLKIIELGAVGNST